MSLEVAWDGKQSFVDWFRGRLGYFGSFVLAWCAINWRILYATVLLKTEELPKIGDKPFANHIAYIENQHTWCAWLFFPALAAMVLPLAIALLDGGVGFGRDSIGLLWHWLRKKPFKDAVYPIAERQALLDAAQGLRDRITALQTHLSVQDKEVGSLKGELQMAHQVGSRFKEQHEGSKSELKLTEERMGMLATSAAAWRAEIRG